MRHNYQVRSQSCVTSRPRTRALSVPKLGFTIAPRSSRTFFSRIYTQASHYNVYSSGATVFLPSTMIILSDRSNVQIIYCRANDARARQRLFVRSRFLFSDASCASGRIALSNPRSTSQARIHAGDNPLFSIALTYIYRRAIERSILRLLSVSP